MREEMGLHAMTPENACGAKTKSAVKDNQEGIADAHLAVEKFRAGIIGSARRCTPSRAGPSPLFFEGAFHLADFLLDLPAYIFDLAFGLQIRIVRPQRIKISTAGFLVLPHCSSSTSPISTRKQNKGARARCL
jgi:hypothetical protein